MSWAPTAEELGQYLRQKNGAPEELMTRTGGTDGFNEEMGWLPGYEGGDVAGDGFDTAFYAEAASAREYARRYGEDGQAQRERALKQLEGTGYEELVMQGLQAEQNSAYREKAAAFLESFMKGEYIPDVQLGELWQSAQAWKLQRTQAGSRQNAAGRTAGANTAREGLNLGSGTAYNESAPNAAEGLTVGESLTEGKDYASAGEMLGEWAEGTGGAKVTNLFETQASVNKKLETYLLNKTHATGGSKAKWFDEALGFNQSNMNELLKQIVFDPKTSIQIAVTEYGIKYNQVISITGANGKVIDVTFAWIKNQDGIVRLVTAIPTKNKGRCL